MKKKTLKNTLIKSRSKPRSSGTKPKHYFKREGKSSSIHKVKNKKFLQFPRIFLTFTEKHFLVTFVSFVFVIVIVVVGLNLYKVISQKQKIDRERQGIISKIQYWQDITNKYKDYRDGYFQLSILEYRLGNFKGSKFYLQKTLDIDPNFEKGRELEQILLSTK